MGDHGTKQRCNPAWSSTMALLGELVSASSPRNGSRYQMIIKGHPKAGSDPHGDLQDLCTLPAAREVMEKHIMSLWLSISFLWEVIAPQLLSGTKGGNVDGDTCFCGTAIPAHLHLHRVKIAILRLKISFSGMGQPKRLHDHGPSL